MKVCLGTALDVPWVRAFPFNQYLWKEIHCILAIFNAVVFVLRFTFYFRGLHGKPFILLQITQSIWRKMFVLETILNLNYYQFNLLLINSYLNKQ